MRDYVNVKPKAKQEPVCESVLTGIAALIATMVFVVLIWSI